MNYDARHRLEDLLGREIAAAQSLAQTLAAERAALTGDSPEAVKEKAAEKIGLLGSIEELEGERRTLWGTSGSDGAAFGHTVAERIRLKVQRRAIAVAQGVDVSVTISIGGAFAPQWVRSSATLWIERADQQLYRAKAEGRNKACLEQPTVSQVSAEEKTMLFGQSQFQDIE